MLKFTWMLYFLIKDQKINNWEQWNPNSRILKSVVAEGAPTSFLTSATEPFWSGSHRSLRFPLGPSGPMPDSQRPLLLEPEGFPRRSFVRDRQAFLNENQTVTSPLLRIPRKCWYQACPGFCVQSASCLVRTKAKSIPRRSDHLPGLNSQLCPFNPHLITHTSLKHILYCYVTLY